MTKARTFANVWEAIEDSPEEAATMTMRSNVMSAIKEKVHRWNTTQARAARRLGITQPRLNDLLHGKINKFSLDTLTILATRAGLKVKIFGRPPKTPSRRNRPINQAGRMNAHHAHRPGSATMLLSRSRKACSTRSASAAVKLFLQAAMVQTEEAADLMLAQGLAHDIEPARGVGSSVQLICVSCLIKLTHMEKIQVYLRKDELDALRKPAARSRRSVAAFVREALRKVVLMPAAEGPIAILSAVDATSFVIMKRARIRLAYTFEHHFAVVGFRMVT